MRTLNQEHQMVGHLRATQACVRVCNSDILILPSDELRAFLLEEELQDLRNALAEEKSRNTRLMRVVEQKIIEQQKR